MQGSRFDVTLSWTPPSSSSQGEHDDDGDEDSKDNFSHIESTDSGDEIIDLGNAHFESERVTSSRMWRNWRR